MWRCQCKKTWDEGSDDGGWDAAEQRTCKAAATLIPRAIERWLWLIKTAVVRLCLAAPGYYLADRGRDSNVPHWLCM